MQTPKRGGRSKAPRKDTPVPQKTPPQRRDAMSSLQNLAVSQTHVPLSPSWFGTTPGTPYGLMRGAVNRFINSFTPSTPTSSSINDNSQQRHTVVSLNDMRTSTTVTIPPQPTVPLPATPDIIQQPSKKKFKSGDEENTSQSNKTPNIRFVTPESSLRTDPSMRGAYDEVRTDPSMRGAYDSVRTVHASASSARRRVLSSNEGQEQQQYGPPLVSDESILLDDLEGSLQGSLLDPNQPQLQQSNKESEKEEEESDEKTKRKRLKERLSQGDVSSRRRMNLAELVHKHFEGRPEAQEVLEYVINHIPKKHLTAVYLPALESGDESIIFQRDWGRLLGELSRRYREINPDFDVKKQFPTPKGPGKFTTHSENIRANNDLREGVKWIQNFKKFYNDVQNNGLLSSLWNYKSQIITYGGASGWAGYTVNTLYNWVNSLNSNEVSDEVKQQLFKDIHEVKQESKKREKDSWTGDGGAQQSLQQAETAIDPNDKLVSNIFVQQESLGVKQSATGEVALGLDGKTNIDYVIPEDLNCEFPATQIDPLLPHSGNQLVQTGPMPSIEDEVNKCEPPPPSQNTGGVEGGPADDERIKLKPGGYVDANGQMKWNDAFRGKDGKPLPEGFIRTETGNIVSSGLKGGVGPSYRGKEQLGEEIMTLRSQNPAEFGTAEERANMGRGALNMLPTTFPLGKEDKDLYFVRGIRKPASDTSQPPKHVTVWASTTGTRGQKLKNSNKAIWAHHVGENKWERLYGESYIKPGSKYDKPPYESFDPRTPVSPTIGNENKLYNILQYLNNQKESSYSADPSKQKVPGVN